MTGSTKAVDHENEVNDSVDQIEEKESVRSVVRAFHIIEALAKDDGQPKGIQDLAVLTSLTKATVHRIISTLVNLGYVDKDVNGKYVLGLRVISLSTIILNNLRVANIAQNDLDLLAKQTELTTHLAIIDNNDLLYLAKANSNQSIQTTSYIGQRSYIHSTSLGKAICAYLPADRVKKILVEKGMRQFTEKTIITIGDYLTELQRVKENGYAIDNEENEKYVRCVAAPIFDHTGSVIASISVSGLVIHIKEEDIPDLSVKVKTVADQISKKMGYSTEVF